MRSRARSYARDEGVSVTKPSFLSYDETNRGARGQSLHLGLAQWQIAPAITDLLVTKKGRTGQRAGNCKTCDNEKQQKGKEKATGPR